MTQSNKNKRNKTKKFLAGFNVFLSSFAPVQLVALGYFTYMVCGWILLSMPFSQQESVSGLDTLFISVSAVSTTGLVTVDMDSFTFFGQLVILLLIQLGGVGYMTLGSFIILSRGKDLSDLRQGVSDYVFSLPSNFRMDKFIRSVIIFTVCVEGAGFLALYYLFRQAQVESTIWNAAFHSVSAFCTAGFSLFSTSLERFTGNFWINAVVGILSFTGSVGFIVLVDVWRRFAGKINHITFTSKIILRISAILLVFGALMLLVIEPEFADMDNSERILASLFQSMTAMTTVGFNTHPTGALAQSSLLILTFLMIIGASPSGTGGGIKSTSFTAIWGMIRSSLKGEADVQYLGRKIPESRIRTAMASTGLYMFFLIAGIFALTLTEQAAFEDLFFESASAIGTVGLSTGVTSALSSVGKIIVCVLMYAGRVGPLTFAIAFSLKRAVSDEEEEDVAV